MWVLKCLKLFFILVFFIMLKLVKVFIGFMLKNLKFICIGNSKLFIDLFLKNFLLLLNDFFGVLKVKDIIYLMLVRVLFVL